MDTNQMGCCMNLQDYHQKGYIRISGLFSDSELDSFQKECERLLELDLVHPENGRTPYRFDATEFPERIDPVVDISPLFHKLVQDKRLTDILEKIFKEKAVLFKDKLILKGPGVQGYEMHQDWAWGWQDLCPAEKILSVSIQIDGANAENGGIEMFDGYHDKLLTPPGQKMNFSEKEKALIDFQKHQPLETNPGDVLIFHSLTPHQSGRNTSNRWRKSLYLSYNAESVGNQRQHYYDNYRTDEKNHQGAYFR